MNKVSVIMNSYNESETKFKNAVESVLNSVGVETQLILSTVKYDSSIHWSKNYKIDLVINDNPGIFTQINNAIKSINGDFVTYFSSNDIMGKFKLKIESDFLIKNNKKVCYSAFYKTNIDGKKSVKSFYDYDYNKHLEGNFVSDCSLVEREVFLKYSPFIIEYGNHSFHDFWLRIYKGEGNVFFYNPIPTWEYIVSEDSSHYKRIKNPIEKEKNEDSRRKMLLNYI